MNRTGSKLSAGTTTAKADVTAPKRAVEMADVFIVEICFLGAMSPGEGGVANYEISSCSAATSNTVQFGHNQLQVYIFTCICQLPIANASK